MKKILTLVCSAAMLIASAAAVHPVAKESKSGMVIVYNPKGDVAKPRRDHIDGSYDTSKFAAGYLADFLKQITGAEFQIMEESKWDGKTPAFLIGNTEFAKKNGIDFHKFRKEEWLYKSIGQNIVMGGGVNFGQRTAINRFLENETGYRWLAFDGKYIPNKPTLELSALDKHGEPSFKLRSLYMGDQVGKLNKKVLQFYRFNNCTIHGREPMLHSRQYAPEHSLYCVVDPDIYFKDHPEYFSMNAQGKRFHGIKKLRAGGGVCLSNPDVAKAAAARIREFIARDRKDTPKESWPEYYSLQQLDSTEVQCLCPECKRITAAEGGTEAAIYILFMNRIAEDLEKDYPDVKLKMSAYVTTTWPPKTIRPHKNILIECCDNHTTSDCFRPLTHPINAERKKVLESWVFDGKKSAQTHIWDYWHQGGSKYFATPRVETMAQAIKPDLDYFYKLGILNVFVENENQYYDVNGMFYDMQMYLALKLMEDISRDDKPIIEEFMRLYYGPASKPVYAAYRKLSEAVYNCKMHMNACNTARPYQTAELLKDLYNLLKEGQQSVKVGTPERYRVEREMLRVLQTMVYYENFRMGRTKEDVLNEFRTMLMRQLRYIYLPDEIKKIMPRVEKNIERISFDFKTPEKFASLPENDIRKFSAIDFGAGIVEDPESPLKKVVRIGVTHYLRQHWNAKAHAQPCTDTLFGKTIFGVCNRTMGGDWRINVEEMPPQDEKYHWYCIRNCHLGAQTGFWAWAENNYCSLDKAYRDGSDNHWDVWFSLKMVGPSYVMNSKQKDNFFLECIILTRPGAIK